MKPDQIACVTASFAQLVLVEDTLAALFYRRLFMLEPSFRGMFGADMRIQGRKFSDMLYFIVGRLHDHNGLLQEIQEHGRRHRAYGVRAEHYAPVGAALLWAIEQILNERYTRDVEQAWAELYRLIATTMQEAATQ